MLKIVLKEKTNYEDDIFLFVELHSLLANKPFTYLVLYKWKTIFAFTS